MVKLTDIELILNADDKNTYCDCTPITNTEGETSCITSEFTDIGGIEALKEEKKELNIPKYVRWICIISLILAVILLRKVIFSKSKLHENMATILIALNALHIDAIKDFFTNLFNPVKLFK